MNSEKFIQRCLGMARREVGDALMEVDEETIYLQEDLEKLFVAIEEMRNKMLRDEMLRADRVAFADPGEGLGEWVNGG